MGCQLRKKHLAKIVMVNSSPNVNVSVNQIGSGSFLLKDHWGLFKATWKTSLSTITMIVVSIKSGQLSRWVIWSPTQTLYRFKPSKILLHF